MARRGTVSRKASKPQHRKPTRPKRSGAPTAARRTASIADLQDALTTTRKHLAEALEQHTATAEVLRIIRASPSKLEQVLEVVVRSAARFCGANDVTIFERDGHELRAVAHWDLFHNQSDCECRARAAVLAAARLSSASLFT